MFLSILMVGAIFGFWYWGYNRQMAGETIVIEHGNYYFGEVTRLESVGNSGGNRVHYTIFYKGNFYKESKIINKPYWMTLEKNDTILVKAIISDTLEEFVVIEEQQYINLLPCLKNYKQPFEGFSELPCKIKKMKGERND